MNPRVLLAVPLLLVGVVVARAADEWGFDPRFRPLPPADVLVKGDVVLRRRDVDAFVDLVEASFDLAVGAAAETRLRVAIEEGFDRADAQARKAFLERVTPLPALRRLVRDGEVLEAEKGLMAFRRALDAMLQREPPDAVAVALKDLLRRRHETAWAGDPPIHAAAADAWLELAAFLTGIARNEPFAPSKGKEEVARRDLAALLEAKGAAERKRVLQAHRPWIRLQTAWDAGGELKRLELRAATVAFVASILPEDRRVEIGDVYNLEEYARASAVLRDVVPAVDLWSTLASRPSEVLDLVERWLPALPDGEDVLLLYRE